MYTKIDLSDIASNCSGKITMSVDGGLRTFVLRFRYRRMTGLWEMTVLDDKGSQIVGCIPMICGQNLLNQFKHLKIGSLYVVPTVEKTSTRQPTAKNLGREFCLIWGDTDAQ